MADNELFDLASADNYVSGSGYWMQEAKTSFYARFSRDDGTEFALVVESDDALYNTLSSLHDSFGSASQYETMMNDGSAAMRTRGITVMKQNLDILGISYAADATFEELEALIAGVNTDDPDLGLVDPDLPPVISVDKTKLNN